jgi:hypothetical protein
MDGIDGIQANIRALRDRLLAAAADAADESGHLLTSYARAIAPWQDRSGHLRKDIAFEKEVDLSVARITIFHSKTYAPFVEAGTSRSRPYPALWPAVAANVDRVQGIFQRHMRI